MNDAEDALTAAGLSEEHEILIKKYVLAVILHNQLIMAKAWSEAALIGQLNRAAVTLRADRLVV
jgi:hypothetical protein